MLVPITLAVVLLVATGTDLAKGKIYNWLTYPAMAAGLVFNGIGHQLPGFGFSLAGLVAGALIFYPAFYWGGMGAGDIKLMAVVGAFMGWVFVVYTAIYAALIGGGVALVYLTCKGELGYTLVRVGKLVFGKKTGLNEFQTTHSLPYAGILALGAAAAYFLQPLSAIK